MKQGSPLALLAPHTPTEQSFTVAEVPHRAKLDQNEPPGEVPALFKEQVLADLADANWSAYPQPKQYAEVKERFARAVGFSPEQIVITAGCDQMILLAYWAAGGPGRRARFFEPTYPMFAAYGRTTQTELDRVVLGPDFDVAANGLGEPVELLLLVSPNNPTGNGPDRGLVTEALTRPCLVFVDEAYIDYDPSSSISDLVSDHPNLLVGRSLSKSLLAGVRLGYGIGHPEVIAVLERLLFAPYHLSAMQIAAARHFELVRPAIPQMVGAVTSERARVTERLGELGITCWPSRTNFLLFEVADASRTYAKLLDRGVRLRNVSSLPGMGEHLRVTIGAPGENDTFLEALRASI